MSVCMHVCMYVCMYVYMYACVWGEGADGWMCVCVLRVTILPLYCPTRFGDCSRGVIFLCFPLFVKSQNQCFHETKRRVPKYVDIFE